MAHRPLTSQEMYRKWKDTTPGDLQSLFVIIDQALADAKRETKEAAVTAIIAAADTERNRPYVIGAPGPEFWEGYEEAVADMVAAVRAKV